MVSRSRPWEGSLATSKVGERSIERRSRWGRTRPLLMLTVRPQSLTSSTPWELSYGRRLCAIDGDKRLRNEPAQYRIRLQAE